jgi:hypothetical protein
VTAWTAQHRLALYNQIETGPPTSDGWATNRAAGRVHLLCNCGYSSGWIDRKDLPSPDQLKAEHGVPLMSLSV